MTEKYEIGNKCGLFCTVSVLLTLYLPSLYRSGGKQDTEPSSGVTLFVLKTLKTVDSALSRVTFYYLPPSESTPLTTTATGTERVTKPTSGVTLSVLQSA